MKACIAGATQARGGFIKRRPGPWKALASPADDVTILGGFGGEGEKGWAAVGPRYDSAASQYRANGATLKVDYLNVVVSGDLAFTVGIERQANVRLAGQEQPVNRTLRATQVFRRRGCMEDRAPAGGPAHRQTVVWPVADRTGGGGAPVSRQPPTLVLHSGV